VFSVTLGLGLAGWNMRRTNLRASTHADTNGLTGFVTGPPLEAYNQSISGLTEAYIGQVKRVIDFSAALLLLVIFSPAMVFIGILIALGNGRPILYRHARIGRGGRQFYCFKFRTMVKNGDEVLRKHLARDATARQDWLSSRKLRRDPRVTRLGFFFRRTSLDELPQLINVLRGEMSLVGPRPIVAEEARFYGSRIVLYKRVRPGLTGPWQVSGRSDLSYARRVEMDCDYILAPSLRRDLHILLRTIPAVLRLTGSY